MTDRAPDQSPAYASSSNRRHVTGIEAVGLPGNYRFVGVCACGWRTTPMLTRMQVYIACRDHDGSSA